MNINLSEEIDKLNHFLYDQKKKIEEFYCKSFRGCANYTWKVLCILQQMKMKF